MSDVIKDITIDVMVEQHYVEKQIEEGDETTD